MRRDETKTTINLKVCTMLKKSPLGFDILHAILCFLGIWYTGGILVTCQQKHKVFSVFASFLLAI